MILLSNLNLVEYLSSIFVNTYHFDYSNCLSSNFFQINFIFIRIELFKQFVWYLDLSSVFLQKCISRDKDFITLFKTYLKILCHLLFLRVKIQEETLSCFKLYFFLILLFQNISNFLLMICIKDDLSVRMKVNKIWFIFYSNTKFRFFDFSKSIFWKNGWV